MRPFKTTPVLSILLLCAHLSLCQQHDFDSLYRHNETYRAAIRSRTDSADLFNGDEVIKITIVTDYKNLIRQKYQDEYQPGTLIYHISDTVAVRREIGIKPRGNMRRKTCYFPPVTLNLTKKEIIIPSIHEFDKMKMVTECKKGEVFEEYLLSEYCAYRIYNIITEYSFRVRLLELTMADANDNMKPVTAYAFIIESADQLAGRLNAVPIETQNATDQYMKPGLLAYCYMFQYLIGNTDWSIPGQHNIRLIKSTDPTEDRAVAVPYDFDYAGIVDAEYAVPAEQLGIESVRERLYRGVCIEEAYVRAAADRFREVKEQIYGLYESSLLQSQTKRKTIDYLDEFYGNVERDAGLKRNILDQCR